MKRERFPTDTQLLDWARRRGEEIVKRKRFPTDTQLLDWAQKNLMSIDVCNGQIEMDFETWNNDTPFVYQGLGLRNALAAARAATLLVPNEKI